MGGETGILPSDFLTLIFRKTDLWARGCWAQSFQNVKGQIMPHLAPRLWVPAPVEAHVQRLAQGPLTADRVEALIRANSDIHDHACFNLNPATNVMNPRAEAALAGGLGSRPSLGYPGDKYEMGLEAIEEIEVICAELAAQVFNAKFAEVRVGSGALANLYGFMALAKPGDSIIAPPGTVGGHVTHHKAGCAGLYGLVTHDAPIDADGYTLNIPALRELARKVRPKIITVGGSLNLFPHPVAEVRAIADEVGAVVLFDAAHQCGMIAGGAWPNPLEQGAHLITMSTYKSLGGPAGGLIVTNDAAIAERLDAIAYPGLTANFDAGRVAALAIALMDWVAFGRDYATAMVDLAQALVREFTALGLPVFGADKGGTRSHQFAIEAAGFGGGQAASKTLRKAGFLACGIGLPIAPVAGDLNGLRIGTPELVRRGVKVSDAPALAALIAEGLRSNAPEGVAGRTRALRESFQGMHYVAN
jgi:glycine hydroxymethyltransferase